MLETKLKILPESSGVYQFFDTDGKLLYIGKAKVLKNRVKSYFRFTPEIGAAGNLSPRIHKMINEVHDLEFIVVNNEFDALILENSLIKQLKPKYNILLRDDKTYPYIYIDWSQDYPRFEMTRKILKGSKIEYFGPFTSGARDILDSLYESFKLVQKKACIKGKKSCLFYQIEKCLAPCEKLVSPEHYQVIAKEAKEHIQNKNLLLKKLQTKMETLSESLRFEEAAVLRDRVEKIKRLRTVALDMARLNNLDVFYIKEGEKKSALVKLFIRDGKVVSSLNHVFKITGSMEEAYKRAILGAYKEKSPLPPKEIIVPVPFEDMEEVGELVSQTLERRVSIVIPDRGDKKKLLDVALKNAEEAVRQESAREDVQESIREILDLSSYPARIEVFDNSMMYGSEKVGAMVVYEDGFAKESYRRYKLEGGDEYAQMREMLTRRALSFDTLPPPDLWLIDGGLAQLNIAKEVIDSSGANVDVIAIAKEKIDAKAHRAKGGARDKIVTEKGELKLQQNDKRLMFLQKLRDEAHRFAIKFFRESKQKKDKEISLLKVPGIGQGSIKRLIDFFGSFEAVKKASLEELKKVIGKKSAETLFAYLNDGN